MNWTPPRHARRTRALRSLQRGGPFIETDASVEFAYDADESNPIDATREPFPTTGVETEIGADDQYR